jgi:hypothetical protein
MRLFAACRNSAGPKNRQLQNEPHLVRLDESLNNHHTASWRTKPRVRTTRKLLPLFRASSKEDKLSNGGELQNHLRLNRLQAIDEISLLAWTQCIEDQPLWIENGVSEARNLLSRRLGYIGWSWIPPERNPFR